MNNEMDNEILIMWICLLYANFFNFATLYLKQDGKKVSALVQYHGFFFCLLSVINILLNLN